MIGHMNTMKPSTKKTDSTDREGRFWPVWPVLKLLTCEHLTYRSIKRVLRGRLTFPAPTAMPPFPIKSPAFPRFPIPFPSLSRKCPQLV